MAKRRRGKTRALLAIPGRAKNAPSPNTQTPLSPFGTTTQPHPMDAPTTLPPLPQGVIDNIIDHLYDKPANLRSCSLVAKSWKARSQSHLFRKVCWTIETVLGWCSHIPPRSDGLAGHAIGLMVISLLEQERLGPIKDYFTSFRNVTSLALQDLDFDDPLFDPNEVPVYFGHLKPGLTSLTLINANGSCGRLLSFASFFSHLEFVTVSCPGDLIPPDPTIDLEYRPLRGTLFLQGHLNRHTNLIRLLSRGPLPQCHTVHLEHWGRMHVKDFDCLLESCSKSLEILNVSACKEGAEEPASRLRPNFSLCPRLTELRIDLQHISGQPPNLINTLLTSPIALSRITFVIHRKVEPEDVISYVKLWKQTDITIAQFSTKLFCRDGGKRLLLTFKAIRALDFTPLVPHSIRRGVEVVVERRGGEGLTLQTCMSCDME